MKLYLFSLFGIVTRKHLKLNQRFTFCHWLV